MVEYVVTLAGAVCWVICFVWMYRISEKQNRLLVELSAQAQRIEELSQEEHDLIKEVHPKVHDIKSGIDQVASAVKDLPTTAPQAP